MNNWKLEKKTYGSQKHLPQVKFPRSVQKGESISCNKESFA